MANAPWSRWFEPYIPDELRRRFYSYRRRRPSTTSLRVWPTPICNYDFIRFRLRLKCLKCVFYGFFMSLMEKEMK